MVARGPARDRILADRGAESMYVSGLLQTAALDVVTQPAWRSHLRDLRQQLRVRRDLLIASPGRACAGCTAGARAARWACTCGCGCPMRRTCSGWFASASPTRCWWRRATSGFPPKPSGPYLRLNYCGPDPQRFRRGRPGHRPGAGPSDGIAGPHGRPISHVRRVGREHTVTGASHRATFRQLRVPNLAVCRQHRTSWSSDTAWWATASSRRCGRVTPRARGGSPCCPRKPDAAYDRVGLTGYTEHWDRAQLALPGNDYAGDDRVELRLGCAVAEIDREARTVRTTTGETFDYDALVLATGSYALRAAGAGARPAGRARLPHARRSRRDPCQCEGRAGLQVAGRCGDRWRSAGPGSRQRVAAVRADRPMSWRCRRT